MKTPILISVLIESRSLQTTIRCVLKQHRWAVFGLEYAGVMAETQHKRQIE
ncbi:MAG: hypothetical protein P1V19_12445 [Gimesia sp.]|nr:hypothetical protein [Gimesia sp.]